MGRQALTTTGGAVHASRGHAGPFQKAPNLRDTLTVLKWRAQRFVVWFAGWLIFFSASVASANERAAGEPWWAGSVPGYLTALAALLGSVALVIKALKSGRSTKREEYSEEQPQANTGTINSSRLRDIERAQEAYEERLTRHTREMRANLDQLNEETQRLGHKIDAQLEWLERARVELMRKKVD
jgi:hypothetical protein